MGSFWCMSKCWFLFRLSTNQNLSGRLSRWLHQSNCCFLWSTENYIKYISWRYVVKWFPAVVIFLHYLMQVAINRLPVDSAWRMKAVMSLLGVVLHFTGSSTNQGMLMLLLLSTLSGFTKHNRFDNAYITWINEVQAWTVYSTALGPDSAVEISQRIMPLEPMVITTSSPETVLANQVADTSISAVHDRQSRNFWRVRHCWHRRSSIPHNYASGLY